MNPILPAIIAGSQEELNHYLDKVIDHVDTIHLDLMDGKFVPNQSLNFDFNIPDGERYKKEYELHLMVQDPEEYIKKHHNKVQRLLVPIESCSDPDKIIALGRSFGKEIGFVLNPDTNIKTIIPYLNNIKYILIMTVYPGKHGAPFVPEALEKVTELKKINPGLTIIVDGSVNDKTIKQVKEAGTSLFASGSYVVKSNNVENAVKILRNIIE